MTINEELAKRVKTDLENAQYRFGFINPQTDGKHYFKTAQKALDKLDELGLKTAKFQHYTAERQITQIFHQDGAWKSRNDIDSFGLWKGTENENDKPLDQIQAEIDQESITLISERSQLRMQADQVSPDLDKKLALADASAFLRIQNPEIQEQAAVVIAATGRHSAHYKEGLEVAYTGYTNNPPTISKVAQRVAELDELNTQKAFAAIENQIEKVDSRELPDIDIDEARQRLQHKRQLEHTHSKQEQAQATQDVQESEDHEIDLKALDKEPVSTPTMDNQPTELSEAEKKRQLELLEQIQGQFRSSGSKYLFKDQPWKVAFKDTASRIITASNDERVAKAMVTMAQVKQWDTIKVSGHPDFRREVWLEASLRDIGVRGYKPTEMDLHLLDKRREHLMTNAVEQGQERARQPERSQSTAEKISEQANEPKNPTSQQQPEKISTYTGKIIEHGSANYQFKPDGTTSYFVKLETAKGEKTIWGKDLARGISESGVKIGDEVTLEYLGNKPVTVNTPNRDDSGKVVSFTPIETHRNTWEVKSSNAQVAEAVASKVIDANIKNKTAQQTLKKAVNDRLETLDKTGDVPSVQMYDKSAPASIQDRPAPVMEHQAQVERSR